MINGFIVVVIDKAVAAIIATRSFCRLNVRPLAVFGGTCRQANVAATIVAVFAHAKAATILTAHKNLHFDGDACCRWQFGLRRRRRRLIDRQQCARCHRQSSLT